ncbi:hypothetical protein ACU686_16580 [Yinghuangia aomiensis]
MPVNDAAVQPVKFMADTSIEYFRRCLDINAVGQFIGIKAVTNAMTEADGSIGNVPPRTAPSEPQPRPRAPQSRSRSAAGPDPLPWNSTTPASASTPSTPGASTSP